jgi:hypothetical protein
MDFAIRMAATGILTDVTVVSRLGERTLHYLCVVQPPNEIIPLHAKPLTDWLRIAVPRVPAATAKHSPRRVIMTMRLPLNIGWRSAVHSLFVHK